MVNLSNRGHIDQNYIGKHFGDYEVIGIERSEFEKADRLVCKCIRCGNKVMLLPSEVRQGRRLRCDCSKELHRFTENNGGKNFWEYSRLDENKLKRIHRRMISRCYNQNDRSYHLYGGRGITIDSDWLQFENFKEWAINNGYRPWLNLKRYDENLGFNHINCYWGVGRDSHQNRLIVDFKSVEEFCNQHGIDGNKAVKDIMEGWLTLNDLENVVNKRINKTLKMDMQKITKLRGSLTDIIKRLKLYGYLDNDVNIARACKDLEMSLYWLGEALNKLKS